MINFFLVFIGGACGSVSRYLATQLINYFFVNKFFLGTILVNILGSFLIGMLYILASEQVKVISEQTKLFLITGFLGGFTTFSAFSLDFFKLIEAGQIMMAIFYILISVVFSLLAVFAGFYLTKFWMA